MVVWEKYCPSRLLTCCLLIIITLDEIIQINLQLKFLVVRQKMFIGKHKSNKVTKYKYFVYKIEFTNYHHFFIIYKHILKILGVLIVLQFILI